MRRHRHFQDTKHAVFLEQARQNLSQYKDDTQLAKQAEQASLRARSFAFLLGKADQWAAYQDDTKGGDRVPSSPESENDDEEELDTEPKAKSGIDEGG